MCGAPQFGDFDKEVVIEEKGEYQGYKCKVITTHSGQKHIDAKVAELNEKLKAVK